MVKSEFDEGLCTLDVTVVVAHNDQVIIILLRPVVIELDSVLRVSVVHQHCLNLLLKFSRSGTIKIVRESSSQSLDNIEFSS